MRRRTVGELAAQRGVPLEELVRTPLSGCSRPTRPCCRARSAGTSHASDPRAPRRRRTRAGRELAPTTLVVARQPPRAASTAVALARSGGPLELSPPAPRSSRCALGVPTALRRSLRPRARVRGRLGAHVATLDGRAQGATSRARRGAGARAASRGPRALPAPTGSRSSHALGGSGRVVLEGFTPSARAALGAELLGVWSADPEELAALAARLAPDVALVPRS